MGIGYMAKEDEGAIGADWAIGAEGAEGAIGSEGVMGAEEDKGSCHLRFSGIRPLRGGEYPPFPLRKKTFFFSH